MIQPDDEPRSLVVSVLVIEAGPLDRGEDGILVPGAYAPYLYFWPNLVSVPQAGLNDREIGVITAQVVGGGSTINAMVYLRCAIFSRVPPLKGEVCMMLTEIPV